MAEEVLCGENKTCGLIPPAESRREAGRRTGREQRRIGNETHALRNRTHGGDARKLGSLGYPHASRRVASLRDTQHRGSGREKCAGVFADVGINPAGFRPLRKWEMENGKWAMVNVVQQRGGQQFGGGGQEHLVEGLGLCQVHGDLGHVGVLDPAGLAVGGALEVRHVGVEGVHGLQPSAEGGHALRDGGQDLLGGVQPLLKEVHRGRSGTGCCG